MKNLTDFFFMRNGFQTFHLEPLKHNFLLFGKRDRAQRDYLLVHLEELSYSLEGYKCVVIGDYGRGKTHQSRNLEFEIKRRRLSLYPIYLKCTEFKTKEPFSNFFKELVLGIPTEFLNNMAQAYEGKVRTEGLSPLQDVIDDEDVARVFRAGLAAPNLDVVRLSMRWLGGEQKLDMRLIAGDLPPLQVSKQFGSVMKGLVHLFLTIEGAVPVYFIDEAERFALVTNADFYWSWCAALRELTEIVGVGLVFFIGSKSRDDIPVLFMQHEVMTRIGTSNYVELYNQGREDLRDFLDDLFQTLIRKGPVPEIMKPVLREKFGEEILDDAVPEELKSILDDNGESINTYPLTNEAFEQLIEHCAMSDLSNKPRELLKLLQKAASRAMRIDTRLIDASVLEEIVKDGI